MRAAGHSCAQGRRPVAILRACVRTTAQRTRASATGWRLAAICDFARSRLGDAGVSGRDGRVSLQQFFS
jgi:hypothetical protein